MKKLKSNKVIANGGHYLAIRSRKNNSLINLSSEKLKVGSNFSELSNVGDSVDEGLE